MKFKDFLKEEGTVSADIATVDTVIETDEKKCAKCGTVSTDLVKRDLELVCPKCLK